MCRCVDVQGEVVFVISIPKESRIHEYKRHIWVDIDILIEYFRINYKSCFRSTCFAPPQSPSSASAMSPQRPQAPGSIRLIFQ